MSLSPETRLKRHLRTAADTAWPDDTRIRCWHETARSMVTEFVKAAPDRWVCVKDTNRVSYVGFSYHYTDVLHTLLGLQWEIHLPD